MFVAAVIAGIILGLLLARPAIAQAPQSNSSITNPPYGPRKPTISVESTSILSTRGRSNSGRHTTPTETYKGRIYSKEEVIQLIKDYSAQYGISPDLPLAVARCESGYNQFSKNKNSTASGVFQWLSSSWANQPDGKLGVSVFDAEANVKTAVWLIANGKTSPWNASINCWSK